MKIVVFRALMMLDACPTEGYNAHPLGMPKRWECGKSREEAIGKLIITCARAWHEEYPDLEVIEA